MPCKATKPSPNRLGFVASGRIMSDETTTLLRETLRAEFPDMEATYDWRPPWMWQKDRLAVYFPAAKVAVEFSPECGDVSLGRKWAKCKENGVALYLLTLEAINQRQFSILHKMIASRSVMVAQDKARSRSRPRSGRRSTRRKTSPGN